MNKKEEMNGFFNNLYEHCSLGEFRRIEIRGIVFGKGVRKNEWVYSPDDVYTVASNPYNGLHMYFACGVRKPNEGDKNGVVGCPFLWTEIDFKETSRKKALQNIKECPFPPTYIILSGGGFHLYWKLKETFYIQNKEDIKTWESYLKRLCYAMDGDRSCAEIARILRVPYTTNFKYDHKPMVKVAKETNYEYDLAEIAQLLPPEPEISRRVKKTAIAPINWDSDGFIQKAYAGSPYGDGHRNEIVKEVIKYYANNLPPDSDVFLHSMMFVDKCVIKGKYGNDGGVYDERDMKRRVQWAIENRRVNKVLNIEKETEKGLLVRMWLPKDRVAIKED
jgi:hypothetical protein